MIGMWLMYARTEEIVLTSLSTGALSAARHQIEDGIATQIFGVVGGSDLPAIWAFAGSLPIRLALAVLIPGLLALSLHRFQNDSGLRGNNGLSGLQNISGLDGVPQASVSIRFLWASAAALGLGYIAAAFTVSGKFGSVIKGIRDDEQQMRASAIRSKATSCSSSP